MRAPTRWTIAFSAASRSGSANTIFPTFSRSMAPSGSSTSTPNSATTAARPGVPGSTTSRAILSASMIIAPRSSSRADTSLLPDPIPPVSPTFSTGLT